MLIYIIYYLLVPIKGRGRQHIQLFLPGFCLCSGPANRGGVRLGRFEASLHPQEAIVAVLFSAVGGTAQQLWFKVVWFWWRTRSIRLWNSKMLNKRLQGCLLLLVFLATNAYGSHPEAITGSEEHSLGNRRLLQTTPTASSGMFCVAKEGADPMALQNGLRWACGPGHADCTAIQQGGSCYKQNNLQALASYAYNDYYHRNANSGGTCDFNGTATTTTTDPSSGQCVFAGSTMSGGNSSTTPAANAPSTGFNPPSSFTPGTGSFGNGSSYGSPTGALIPLDGAESFMSGARRALCVLLLLALPLFFGL